MDGMGRCMDNARTDRLQRPVKCEAADREEPGGRVRVSGGDRGVAAALPPGTAARGVGRRDAAAGLAGPRSVQRAVRPQQGRGGRPVAREGLEEGLRAWGDPTFRVFPHDRVRAARAGGRLESGRGGPAREPGRNRATLGLRLPERVVKGIREPGGVPRPASRLACAGDVQESGRETAV